MNLDDLWIGDKILVKSVQEVGTFEKKISETRAIIKFKIGTSEIYTDDMVLANDKPLGPVKHSKEKDKPGLFIEKDKPDEFNVMDKANFNKEIDLHFEKLMPGKNKSDYVNILDFQLKACKAHIERALEFRVPDVKIIHGKGNGTLRTAVINLLKDYRENIIWNFEGENKGGAVIVLFRYD